MSWNPPPNGRHPHTLEWETTTNRTDIEDQQLPGRNHSPTEIDPQSHYPPEHLSLNHPRSHLSHHPFIPHQQHPQHHQPHPHIHSHPHPHPHAHPHSHPHSHAHPPPPPPPPHLPPIQQERPISDQSDMYAQEHQMYPYRVPPHQLPSFQQSAGFQQPAPRQRTAIACRYCRRRKIRCSGFESSPDGRCANCLRFNQECVFTPVSSQAQAFIPAHAAYPHMKRVGGRGGQPVLYGAHGQPLPPNYNSLPPPPTPPAQSPMDFHPPQQYPRPLSPVTGSIRQQPPPPAQLSYGGSYEEQMAYDAERARNQEPHSGVLPPPVSGSSQPHPLQRRSSACDYPNHYGRNDPPSPSSHLLHTQHAYSPPPVSGPPSSSFSASSYGQGPPPSAGSSYYSQASASSQQRTRSPVGYHSPDRSSGSPHPFHPPMQYPPPPPPPPARPASSGASPSSPSTIPPMQMANLIDPSPPTPGQQSSRNQRTAADGDMLDRLMPRSGL